MNSAEVHSQLIGCTVKRDLDGSCGVVTAITTGEVPELCVRLASGRVDWVVARDWLVARGADEQVAPGAIEEPQRVREELREWERKCLPKIPYVEKAAHV